MTVTASIVGGTGFTGGELLRLLVGHPEVEIGQVSSRKSAGKPLHTSHPNLRGHIDRLFCVPEEIEACDVLFLCMPHGKAAADIDHWRAIGKCVIDLSADFRLRDPAVYEQWYGGVHPAPDILMHAVYGLPEISRDSIRGTPLISGVGCNATAMTLALLPLARAGLIERVVADIKVGSSESGAEPGAGSNHAVRARTARTYSPFGHRHIAEVNQSLGPIDLDATVTAIDMVRGVLCTAHVEPKEPVTTRDLWKLYRETYGEEPFVRIVADRTGPGRFPDPRVVVGSNHADVGFAVDERSGRIIALCAIDNLVKGAAGSAVQAMNIALGLEEHAGLGFPGLHPA
ncbi:MAG: N-acetyl-gamma-glutamyl-phosphate reductase [Phycisphaera sp.]|nr:MAG: N-acetyl-gamma-glutamyl-phosphate reductase [Phycisphaera sp.]